jgi:hypothetical protein
MDIKPSGSAPSRRMPGDWFTGTVWQTQSLKRPRRPRIRAARVSFEPGARAPRAKRASHDHCATCAAFHDHCATCAKRRLTMAVPRAPLTTVAGRV